MGKKSVKWVLTILLITCIAVCGFRWNTVSMGMQMKADGYYSERSGRLSDTTVEEVVQVTDAETESTKKTEAASYSKEKIVQKSKSYGKKDSKNLTTKTSADTNDVSVDPKADNKNKESRISETVYESEGVKESDSGNIEYPEEKKKTETPIRELKEQKTEAHTEQRTEARIEQRTEAKTEQQTESHTETYTEQRTEQRIEVHVEQKTEQPVESKTEQKTEAPKCTHKWVWQTHIETIHHDAVYEEYLICEAYDEPVYESHTFCNNCGLDLTVNFGGSSTSEAVDHMFNVCGGCGYSNGQAVVGNIHHDARYGTKCTALAYDEDVEVKDYEYCSICGAKK